MSRAGHPMDPDLEAQITAIEQQIVAVTHSTDYDDDEKHHRIDILLTRRDDLLSI